jgi:hypothetical protein
MECLGGHTWPVLGIWFDIRLHEKGYKREFVADPEALTCDKCGRLAEDLTGTEIPQGGLQHFMDL